MNFNELKEEFINESIKLTKDIKNKWIPTTIDKIRIFYHKINNKIIKKLRGKKYYNVCLFITCIGMFVCLFLYFIIPKKLDRLYNLFGNAFIGFLTGFVVMFLGNIKNREIEFCDNEIQFYKDLIKDISECNKKIGKLFNSQEYNTELIHSIIINTNNLLSKIFNDIYIYGFNTKWYFEFNKKFDIQSLIKELQELRLENADNTILNQEEYEKLYSNKISYINTVLIELKSTLHNENIKIMNEKYSLENGIL